MKLRRFLGKSSHSGVVLPAAYWLSIAGLTFAAPASAFDWNVNAKVTIIESTYMPGQIAFQIDTAGGPCTAGTWLFYQAQGSTTVDKANNAAATLSLLLTAAVADKTITLYGFNTGCVVEHVWINR